jgi:hypothetical protein
MGKSSPPKSEPAAAPSGPTDPAAARVAADAEKKRRSLASMSEGSHDLLNYGGDGATGNSSSPGDL